MNGYTVIFISVLCTLTVLKIDQHACIAKARSFEEIEWGPIQGCMVKHNDRWLPLENIRGFNTVE